MHTNTLLYDFGRIAGNNNMAGNRFGHNCPTSDDRMTFNRNTRHDYTSDTDDTVVANPSIRDETTTIIMGKNHRIPQNPNMIADPYSFGIHRFVQMSRPGYSAIFSDMHPVPPA